MIFFLKVKCDNLAEKEEQLREVIERLEGEKVELITKQNELVKERDNLLTRCEEFTQTIYEYDVEKITMAGKMEEMQNKLEVITIGLYFFLARQEIQNLSLRQKLFSSFAIRNRFIHTFFILRIIFKFAL